MNKKILYIIQRTFNESFIGIYKLFDILIPDLTLFSPLRKVSLSILTFSRIWSSTRIKKNQHLTHLRKLQIWNNCFINRNNIFDNNSMIDIWNNCSIWYNNTFITSSHYEKQNIKRGNLNFTTFSKDISIWNNVWITSNCTILPWTVIEDNVIIAAGSVCKGKLNKNNIYWWTPAKILRETKGFISKIT